MTAPPIQRPSCTEPAGAVVEGFAHQPPSESARVTSHGWIVPSVLAGVKAGVFVHLIWGGYF